MIGQENVKYACGVEYVKDERYGEGMKNFLCPIVRSRIGTRKSTIDSGESPRVLLIMVLEGKRMWVFNHTLRARIEVRKMVNVSKNSSFTIRVPSSGTE